MKKIYRQHLRDKRGETIVEVVVAFTLLSIMLLLFSQGLAAASKTDMKAMQTREAADKAMLNLQKEKADQINPPNKAPVSAVDGNVIYRQVYQITDEESGEIYTYVVYSTGN